MGRALARIRLSRSSEASTSEDRQREQITAWADANGHEIVGWAVDIDVSGSVRPFEAPDLSRWFQPDHVDEWDILAAAAMDRISRNLFDFNEICQWTQRNGKSVASVKENLDLSGIAGKMMALVLGIIAEGELEAIRARNRASQAELRKRGRWHGGPVPFGYKVEKSGEGDEYGWYFHPDETESLIVSEMFQRASTGEPLQRIADDLTERGVRSRRQDGESPRWTRETIRRILASRNVLGQSSHDGTVVVGADGMPVQRAEPLVSFDLWQRVQEVRVERDFTRTRDNGTGMLLNIAFCAECDEPLYYAAFRPKGREYHYWKCAGRNNKRNGCSQTSVRAELLEEFVESQMLDEIGSLDRTKRVFRQAEGYAEDIARTEEAIARLRAESDAGIYEGDTDGYLARLKPLVERRKTLSELPNRPAGWDFVTTGETYAEAWERMDKTERRDLLLESGIQVHARMIARKVPDFRFFVPVDVMQKAVPGWSPSVPEGV